MRVSFFLAFASLCASWAQTGLSPTAPPAMPDLPAETVVAIFSDGTKFTMGDFRRIFEILSPDEQQLALHNRELWLHRWYVLRKLTKLAEDAKLDQESPTKEVLAWSRLNLLATAQIRSVMNATVVEPADIVKQYDSNKAKYTQVRVKAIYIAFNDDAAAISASKGKRPLTEADAKAKAVRLLAAIKSGADFVTLVKENSDDETSREKDGYLATLHSTDNIPDVFRNAVFNMQKGDVSEPLRQPNGFYILRAEEVTVRPLSEVRGEIHDELQDLRSHEWLRGVDHDVKVQIVNPAFISGISDPAKR